MSNPCDVYCDNDILKSKILSVSPSSEGLFPHEIAMLLYVSWGQYTTKKKTFSGVWYYQYYVKHASRLLDSLIERGYVRECEDEELADCIGMKDIQSILKNHGVKPGNVREKSVSTLKELLTGAEIYKECGYRPYVLTEAGEEALDNQRIAEGKHLELWRRFRQDKSIERLKPEQVKIVDIEPEVASSIYELNINTKNELSILRMMTNPPVIIVDETDTSRTHNVYKPVTIKVLFDGCLIAEEEGFNTYQILHASQKLLLGKSLDARSILCKCYDIRNKCLVGEATIPSDIYANGINYEMQDKYNHLGDESERIFDGNSFTFYFSVNDGFAEEIINKHISRYADVQLLESLIPEDNGKNYRITVDKSKEDIRETLMFMFVDGRLDVPLVLNAPINRIMKTLMCRSDNEIVQALFDEHSTLYSHNTLIAVKQILEAFSNNAADAIFALHKIYPYRVLCTSFKEDLYDIEYSYRGVKQYYQKFSTRFQKLLVRLREEGIIDIKWVSEFNLYVLIKKKYPNCIYQCKFDWLGQQSIDIYIPDIKVAVEYQGQQHYKSVEIFGGEEGLRKTQERDERKRKLCAENGIHLVYWPYTVEISNEKLDNIFKKNNITSK